MNTVRRHRSKFRKVATGVSPIGRQKDKTRAGGSRVANRVINAIFPLLFFLFGGNGNAPANLKTTAFPLCRRCDRPYFASNNPGVPVSKLM